MAKKTIIWTLWKQLSPIVIHCDNQGCIKLSVNFVFHNRLKHIETPYHYIRDIVDINVIKMIYINTNEQNVNILTKPLAKLKIVYFRGKLGMTNL